MGHRTLVAYDRDGYDLHYSHWGVDPGSITPETPFGGQPDAGWAGEIASDLLDAAGGHLTDDHETAVDPDPLATGLSFREVCQSVDPLVHEALFVVDSEFTVRTYLVLALGSPERDRLRAALVGYDGETDAAYLRGWLAGARSVRDVHDLDSEAVVRALRWLDADRGTLVYLDRGRGDAGQDDRGEDDVGLNDIGQDDIDQHDIGESDRRSERDDDH